jgi:hypothetical protein
METPRIWGDITTSDFLAVRELVHDVSKRTFRRETLDLLIDKKDIEKEREKAKAAGKRAEEFDPHSRIFVFLDRLSVAKKLIVTAAVVVVTVAHFQFGVSEGVATSIISSLSSPIFLFGITGVGLYGVWNLYLLALRYNRKVIRGINREIRYSDKIIDNQNSLEEIRAYRRWNNNLTNSVVLCIILLLAVARAYAPSTFTAGSEESKEWVPEYVETKASERIDEDEFETDSPENDSE